MVPHENPSVAARAAGNIPSSRNLAIAGVTVYGGVTAVRAVQDTKNSIGRGIQAIPSGVAELAREATAAAAAAATGIGDGPEAAYNAMLAEIHQLEAGVKSRASSFSESGAIHIYNIIICVHSFIP